MRVRTFSVLFILMALMFIIAVATEVYVDDFVRPQTLFAYMLASTLVSSVASLAISIDVPS